MNNTTEEPVLRQGSTIIPIGTPVFFTQSEQYWDKPYPMKRSDHYQVKSIILKGILLEVEGNRFKVKLVDNNGFEKDGEDYVFSKGTLLCNQNFTDFATLGVWNIQK